MQQNLEKNHAMTFRVTQKERDMIRKAQARTRIKSLRAYLLKMAVDGRVVEIELENVREMNRLLSNATNNIDQIARKVNETGSVHLPDIESIRSYWKSKSCLTTVMLLSFLPLRYLTLK